MVLSEIRQGTHGSTLRRRKPTAAACHSSPGYVCVATLHTGGITAISPDDASVEHVPLLDPVTTNICFGGPDLCTAYITLSQTGRLVALPWPRPGLALHYLHR